MTLHTLVLPMMADHTEDSAPHAFSIILVSPMKHHVTIPSWRGITSCTRRKTKASVTCQVCQLLCNCLPVYELLTSTDPNFLPVYGLLTSTDPSPCVRVCAWAPLSLLAASTSCSGGQAQGCQQVQK